MERAKVTTTEFSNTFWKTMISVMILTIIGGLAFAAGLAWSINARADEGDGKRGPRVVYPKRTDLDFEGINIEGELKNPAEFYFERRPEEKFDSLVKRRKNFHKEMLRDVVMSK